MIRREYALVKKTVMYLSLLSVLLVAGCTESLQLSTEITLATAQRFHILLKHVGRENGFECHMSGFPEWKLNGLEPAIGNVGEWRFTSSTDADGDGMSDLAMDALVICLQPSSAKADPNILFKWETYDVVLVEKNSFESELGSTETLIASLEGLDKNGEQADARETSAQPTLKSQSTPRSP